MAVKKRMSAKSLNSGSDLTTVKRAGLTIKKTYTRGKELIEKDPWELIPDPSNPRPGEVINDDWLKRVLKLSSDNSLCGIREGEWFIPPFESLSGDLGGAKKEDYDFLVHLSESIRHDGLIEPIEIFLADKDHEPEFFESSDKDHGYVVLEGHQRRLAAMLGGIKNVTCIQITDDTLLAKLKVKHRKIRRQLSENNLRKNLSVGQNYQIVKQLFESLGEGEELSAEELKDIIGLGLKAAQALRKIVVEPEGRYPGLLYEKLVDGSLTLKRLRELTPMSFDEIIDELSNTKSKAFVGQKKKIARGTSGGRKKSSATFKINSKEDSELLSNYLKNIIPDLKVDEKEKSSFKQLEGLLRQLMERAKSEIG